MEKQNIKILASITLMISTGYLVLNYQSLTGSNEVKITNNSTILDTNPIKGSEMDGTLSAYGYVKFVEKPENDSVTVKQTFVNTSCESSKMVVKTNSEPTQRKPIKVSIIPKNDLIAKECIGSNQDIIGKETGREIKFESLNKGQKINFAYDGIKFSYITKGSKNIGVREFKLSGNIRT